MPRFKISRLALLAAAALATLLTVATAGFSEDARAARHLSVPNSITAQAAATIPDAPQNIPPAPPGPSPSPVPRSMALLATALTDLATKSGGHVAVVVRELDGRLPQGWSLNGDDRFVAASTYKLPLLEAEAESLTRGRTKGSDSICYQDSDWEQGWYADYQDGACLSRDELLRRVGHDSDNTAAHMLVREFGGTAALAAYGRAHGANHSDFFDPNLTTAADLASLWLDEAKGKAGGKAAQQLLYALLTHTSFETGIPAGTPPSATVVHKVGMLGDVHNDAALIAAPGRRYVLVVCTEGLSEDAAWALIASVSSATWAFESSR